MTIVYGQCFGCVHGWPSVHADRFANGRVLDTMLSFVKHFWCVQTPTTRIDGVLHFKHAHTLRFMDAPYMPQLTVDTALRVLRAEDMLDAEFFEALEAFVQLVGSPRRGVMDPVEDYVNRRLDEIAREHRERG